MKNLGFVIASKILVDNRLAVKFMYREKGDGNDSGWRFFPAEKIKATLIILIILPFMILILF